MDESGPNEQSLDERVVATVSEKGGIDALLAEFKPFIMSCAHRFNSLNYRIEEDEVVSAAYIAFYEALCTYEIAKGHFLPFASTVIRCRLVDLARRESRSDPYPMSASVMDETGNNESSATMQSAMKLFDFGVQHEMLKYEVASFKKSLEGWGIELEDLLREAPKHKSVVELYRRLTLYVLSNREIMDTVLKKKYFPIKKISDLTNTPQKKIERARKYILASILVATGDFDYLSEYIVDL